MGSKTVKVRNLTLGEGIPKICSPVVGIKDKEILEESKLLKNIGVDLIEWRIDFFERVEKVEAVIGMLSKMRDIVHDTPILVTFRSKREGGEKSISKEYYYILNKKIIDSGFADIIDLELFMGDDMVTDIIKYAQQGGVKVIVSNHNFHKTPTKEELVSRLCKMQDLGADLPKIAVMPKDTSDVITLLQATNEMNIKYAKTPIITMSMGKLGIISRLSGEVFGSALTFGAANKVSASGQVEVKKLKEVLEILH